MPFRPVAKPYKGTIRHTTIGNGIERLYAGGKIQYEHEFREAAITGGTKRKGIDARGRSKEPVYEYWTVKERGALGKHGTLDFSYEKGEQAKDTLKFAISNLKEFNTKGNKNLEETAKRLEECKSCIYIRGAESVIKNQGVFESLLRRAERIAEKRGADVILLGTGDKYVLRTLKKFGYVAIYSFGQGIAGTYLKFVKD